METTIFRINKNCVESAENSCDLNGYEKNLDKKYYFKND